MKSVSILGNQGNLMIKFIKNTLMLLSCSILVIAFNNCSKSFSTHENSSGNSSNNSGALSNSPTSTSADLEVAPGGGGTTYHVGPGKEYSQLGDIPWYKLGPGDTVYIYYKSTPYNEKILISGAGTINQWIRILGVPDPATGALPIISGNNATTGTNMHHHWQDPTLIQVSGVIHIAVHADSSSDPNGSAPLPSYIEIANLQVQDGYQDYKFTAEDGSTHNYGSFAACIYARSARHILIRNNILTNCGLGFYNWTGDGSAEAWWAGLQVDTVVRGNYFYNNGVPNSYTEHQVYTESDGLVVEANYFGPQRIGSLGSQIKDRSAGSVIRYNYIEQSEAGWDIDLVEPQEGCPSLCYSSGATIRKNPKYLQAFVYGNVIVNQSNTSPNFVHWNEDHQMGQGRATEANGILYFYNNTIISLTNSNLASLFNQTYGGYDCSPTPLPGRIDVRNNVIYTTASSFRLGEYCKQAHFDFGTNWVSSGWENSFTEATGIENLIQGASNPGFVSLSDFHLTTNSILQGKGAALSSAITNNYLGLDLNPIKQLLLPGVSPMKSGLALRNKFGTGSDLGAFGN